MGLKDESETMKLPLNSGKTIIASFHALHIPQPTSALCRKWKLHYPICNPKKLQFFEYTVKSRNWWNFLKIVLHCTIGHSFTSQCDKVSHSLVDDRLLKVCQKYNGKCLQVGIKWMELWGANDGINCYNPKLLLILSVKAHGKTDFRHHLFCKFVSVILLKLSRLSKLWNVGP